MKQRIGICTNFGNCPTADSKRKVPITGGEDFCPSCGSQLTEYRPSKRSLARLTEQFLGLFILAGILFFTWQYLDVKSLLSVIHVEKTPRLTRPNCLLDQSPTQDQIVQAQQMLPMTYVPALTKYPIPRDIHPWIKTVDQITQEAFFIMRREVTISEFKRYVESLTEIEKTQLGYDWQQDRNGVPLPDDYPVSSVSWTAAQSYANWLTQLTGCYLALPTYNQWISAVVQYAQPDQAITRQQARSQFLHPIQRAQLPDNVVDLLGNLREWSADTGSDKQTCPNNGHYILGEDYKTWLQYISGQPTCETMALDTIGFRLVRLQ